MRQQRKFRKLNLYKKFLRKLKEELIFEVINQEWNNLHYIIDKLKTDEAPISVSEKLEREDIKKLKGKKIEN